MSLITADELARGVLLIIGGGAAGMLTIAAPGSALWLLPAAGTLAGMALTVPEVRSEVMQALPQLTAGAQLARALLPSRTGADLAKPARRPTPAAAPARPEVAAPARPEAAPNPPELVRVLDEQPHRLIIGHSRGGKTTLIHHLATEWAAQGGRVLVADPDAAPGLWPGCEVRGAGDDLAAIGELLATVAGEVEARRRQRAAGVRHFEPLHLVIDEAQDVIPQLDGAAELFEDVARRGGKLNIRLTIGVQDKQVKTLGLEGKSQILRNFQVADVLKTGDGRRIAVLRDPETGERVRMQIPQLLDPETLITPAPAQGVTRVDPAVSTDALDLLDSLLAMPVSNASGRQDTPAPVSVSVSNRMDTDTDTDTPGGAVSVSLGHDGGHLTVNVNARAEAAPAERPTGRNRTRKGRSFDARRRRLMHQAQNQDAHKTDLQRAYAARKAAGVSYRQAYRELGGSSDETRAWWRAAPGPIETV